MLKQNRSKAEIAVELVQNINSTAMKARESGQSVTVDYGLPCLSVVRGEDDEYFFQEADADRIIQDYRSVISSIEEESGLALSMEDYILYVAQGW